MSESSDSHYNSPRTATPSSDNNNNNGMKKIPTSDFMSNYYGHQRQHLEIILAGLRKQLALNSVDFTSPSKSIIKENGGRSALRRSFVYFVGDSTLDNKKYVLGQKTEMAVNGYENILEPATAMVPDVCHLLNKVFAEHNERIEKAIIGDNEKKASPAIAKSEGSKLQQDFLSESVIAAAAAADAAAAVSSSRPVNYLQPPSSSAVAARTANNNAIAATNNSNSSSSFPAYAVPTTYHAINCAVEESKMHQRADPGNMLPQDAFIRDNMTCDDILVVSLGGFDVALKPTVATMLSVGWMTWFSRESSLTEASAYGLGHFKELLHDKLEEFLKHMCAKTKPRMIIVCMLYYLDTNPNVASWCNPVLSAINYNKNPAQTQRMIDGIFKTCFVNNKIVVPGVDKCCASSSCKSFGWKDVVGLH